MKNKDPKETGIKGVTKGRGGTHNEKDPKNTRKGYKTTYVPKKDTPKPKSELNGQRKVKSKVNVETDIGGTFRTEKGTQVTKKSLLNKNIEKTKITVPSGKKTIKTNMSTGVIKVNQKGKNYKIKK
jgi:hypothetical protein